MNQQDFITELKQKGAVIVGFGDLSELSPDVRFGMSIGVCVAVKYPPEVIRDISALPTADYHDWYNKLNTLLDSIVTFGAELLTREGYAAIAMTRDSVGNGEVDNNTSLPYKTIATRAGIGWIGKCALLINDVFGSAIRLSAILTDAPFEAAAPVNESKCGDCMSCTNACPAGAVKGKSWSAGVNRDELVDAPLCRRAARERAHLGFSRADVTICGKCIEICPYTQRYLNQMQPML